MKGVGLVGNPRLWIAFWSAWRDWRRHEAVVIGYVLKVILACLLALWISLRFELSQPRTALMTVAIVMQSPRAGMVFSKSLYRFLGTLVGIAMAFFLVALFSQERWMFLALLALWIGFCTAGSVIFRAHQSYGFVLAGYTACIIGLPASLDPNQTFNIGMTRVSEILVGLLCATAVSDLVFPQRLWKDIQAAIGRRFQDFSDLLRTSVQQTRNTPETLLLAFSRLSSDIFALETFHASAGLENDPSRTYRLRLRLMDLEFMAASTTFQALHRLMDRQRAGGSVQVVTALGGVIQPLGDVFTTEGHNARNGQELGDVSARLAAYRNGFQNCLAAARASLPDDLSPACLLDFDTGAELAERFSDELQSYVNTYRVFADRTEHGPDSAPSPTLPFHPKLQFDGAAALLAGVRGALALGIMAVVWIAAGWPSGIEAIILGVVTSTLFATAPAPSKIIQQFLAGAALSALFIYLFNFKLLPQAHEYETLALLLVPFIAVTVWISAIPALASVGGSSLIIFFSHVGFSSVYSASPTTYLNEVIADMMAILLSGSMYALIDLSNSSWMRRRAAGRLGALVTSACRDTLPMQRAFLESAARDVVQRTRQSQPVVNQEDRQLLEWLLTTLEVGNAVIALRKLGGDAQSSEIKAEVGGVLEHVATLFEAPSRPLQEATLSALDHAMQRLLHDPGFLTLGFSLRRQLLTSLHFLRSALLDESVASPYLQRWAG